MVKEIESGGEKIEEDQIVEEAFQEQIGKRKLENPVPAIIVIIGLVVGLFFLAPNVTGNVIEDLTNSTSNIIGAVLIVASLVGGFFWLNGRKKSER
ncbi:hypothetical protein CMI37_26685 [Candidatus Pacearchaeota archaeon]|nr:hypothetical protein [Candidatus Pacearchaeota archaeon]|tara:strand:- start:2500 stop:2787 length:288 start_codon:yes stop_codon:yes gene_type:complete